MNKLIFPDRISPAELANQIGVSVGTLAVWRCTGRYEIPYIKIGSKVYYRGSDVQKFLESRTVNVNSSSAEVAANG